MVTTLKPSVRVEWPSYARWVIPAVVVAIVASSLTASAMFVDVLVGAALGLCVSASNLHAVRSMELRVLDDLVVLSRRGREQSVGRIRSLSVERVRVRGAAHPDWQIWRGDGGSVALVESAWGVSELEGLADELGVAVTYADRPLSFRELGQRYPGTLPWYAEHVVPLSIIATVGAILLLATFSP